MPVCWSLDYKTQSLSVIDKLIVGRSPAPLPPPPSGAANGLDGYATLVQSYAAF